MPKAVITSAREAIQGQEGRMDCFVARAPLRNRFAFVAGNDESKAFELHPEE
jgi:hypothetical protein